MSTSSPSFSIIYADPPWQYVSVSHKGTPPYPCLSTKEIAALPIADICNKDCLLFLWTTYPMLPDALSVIKAWGFAYKTVAFTWVKTNPSGRGFHFGLGRWTRSNPEICLLGIRGSSKRVARNVPNLVIAPRRAHSQKPDEVRGHIVSLCGDLPRIELFARQKTDGWFVWGNEVASDIEVEVKIQEVHPIMETP